MKHTRTLAAWLGIGALLLILAAACSNASDGDGDTSQAEAPASVSQQLDGGGEADRLANNSDGRDDANTVGVGDAEPQGAAAGLPPTSPELQGALDRKIIQSSSVDVEVKEVGRDFQEIVRIAETAGGFVSSSSFSNNDDRQVADLTIRVPGERYQSVLAEIRGMGKVLQESSDANDATEEYTDLQARLRTLEATEQRYLELLTQAQGINGILQVQDRLDGVRAQIEQVQGRINLLDHLTELATITVHLRPAVAAPAPTDEGGTGPLEAAGEAWEASLTALGVVATGILVVGVFSWWLLPPLAVVAIAWRWWMNRRQPSAKPSGSA